MHHYRFLYTLMVLFCIVTGILLVFNIIVGLMYTHYYL